MVTDVLEDASCEKMGVTANNRENALRIDRLRMVVFMVLIAFTLFYDASILFGYPDQKVL
jgi:hypothetical protein